MTDLERVPEFGERVPGAHYVRRPGSYGLAFDDLNNVCLMRTHIGLFIPGGGANPGETEVETLPRELREESGYAAAIVRRIGAAVQNVYAEGEGFFAKVCAFYEVQLGEKIDQHSEGDHTLVWLPIDEALERILHRSQRWALETAAQLR